MLPMLTHEEHQAMIMFDRLLMAAKDNETVADLLDQTLNVARMIDPRPDDKVMYGPLQRMHFEWQQMRHRMAEIEKKMDQYINSQNRYPGTYTGPTAYPTMNTASTWPSNPGWPGPTMTGTSDSIGYGYSTNTTATDLLQSPNKYTSEQINQLISTLQSQDIIDTKDITK
jgi:hypothetical protein